MPLPDGVIYLDHAATTPLDTRVLERMTPYFSERFGNPSSVYGLGRMSLEAVDEAHESVARALGCRPTEIIFTGGGSEADNLAIKGIVISARRRGNHIITSAIEHHAILRVCEQLERDGFRVTYLPVNDAGLVDPATVASALTDETAIVTIMYVNNEVGTIQPIDEIAAICRARRVPFHTDAVQAGGSLPLDVARLGVDMLSLSSHKFYGPKGVGILYVRQGVRVQPQVLGGSQERNRRAGTENVPGVVGASYALELAMKERDVESARLVGLRDALIEGVLSIPNTRLTGHPERRAPGNASFVIEGLEGESLLLNLDLAGICASAGSACASGEIEPSHVLTAMGYSSSDARGALRLTLGRSTTLADIETTTTRLADIVQRLRGLSTAPARAGFITPETK